MLLGHYLDKVEGRQYNGCYGDDAFVDSRCGPGGPATLKEEIKTSGSIYNDIHSFIVISVLHNWKDNAAK